MPSPRKAPKHWALNNPTPGIPTPVFRSRITHPKSKGFFDSQVISLDKPTREREVSQPFLTLGFRDSQVMSLLTKHGGCAASALAELRSSSLLAEVEALDALRHLSFVLGQWRDVVVSRGRLQQLEMRLLQMFSRLGIREAVKGWRDHTCWKRHIHWGGAELALRSMLRARGRGLALWRQAARTKVTLRARGQVMSCRVEGRRAGRAVMEPVLAWKEWRRSGDAPYGV